MFEDSVFTVSCMPVNSALVCTFSTHELSDFINGFLLKTLRSLVVEFTSCVYKLTVFQNNYSLKSR